MRFGVVVFPGTWSDIDCFHVLSEVLAQPVDYVWHKETDLSGYDCIILPRRVLLRRLSEAGRDSPLLAGDEVCGAV